MDGPEDTHEEEKRAVTGDQGSARRAERSTVGVALRHSHSRRRRRRQRRQGQDRGASRGWRAFFGALVLLALVMVVPEASASTAVAGTGPAPTVTGVSTDGGAIGSSAGGPVAGGTSVTVTGTSLTGATAVDFGGVAATDVVVNGSGTSLTATSPPGTSLDSVDITVTTPAGTSTTSSADQFTYIPAPTVTGISPGSGPSASGALITITGTNFLVTGTNGRRFVATGVDFDATIAGQPESFPSTDFELGAGGTSIIAATPCLAGADCPQLPDTSGTANVAVTNLGGTSSPSSAAQYAYDVNWSQGVVSGLPTGPGAVSNVTGTGPLFAPPPEKGEPGGPYYGLKVSVNQTQDLTDQAISVTWTGGTPTLSDSTGDFLGDYLQVFECWSASSASGPNPQQCEYGGESASSTNYPILQQDQADQQEFSRVLAEPGWSTYDGSAGSCTNASGTDVQSVEPCIDTTKPEPTDLEIEPFEAANGTVVTRQADYNYDLYQNSPQDFWLDPYFSFDTTNEVDFARTLPSASCPTGTPGEYYSACGQQLFDVDTGLTAPGLGCGQNIQASGSGSATPKCWLVIVPRGDPAQENPAGAGSTTVQTSPLSPQAWANRITIPLEFNPVGTSCSINANAQQIEGSELAAPAVASWEPALCDQPGGQAYSYLQNNDDQARENITNPTYGSVGMSVISDPIPTDQTSATNPVVYAPLTLSGAVIAFNIERVPALEPDGTSQTDESAQAGSRIQNIYLTPLLVAKLLTESYQAELKGVAGEAEKSSPNFQKYQWVQNNPVSLFDDPQFLQYNPEFELLSTTDQLDAGNMVVEEGSADATATLWKWVLSDPAARAWLDGTPTPDGEPGGMRVNPYYSINPAINPAHVAFGTPVPDDYAKSDPYCDPTKNYVDGVNGNAPQLARQICIQDWSPYVGSMAAAAQAAANANDGGKTTFNPANSPDTAWTSNGPEITGQDLIISVTDSASAARYGLQTASLSPSGEDSDPTFVAPDQASLLAGEQAMAPSGVSDVLETNPSSTAPDAYPLTMLTYAAATPEILSQAERQNYAAFLDYAAGPGQMLGYQPGDLPSGYAPLPPSLTSETLAAANEILHPPVFPTSTTTPATSNSLGGGLGGTSFGSEEQPSDGSPSNFTTPASSSSSRFERSKSVPAALSSVRISGVPVGMLKWVLPLLLLFGLLSALGALATKMFGAKAATEGGPAEAADAGTAEESGGEAS